MSDDFAKQLDRLCAPPAHIINEPQAAPAADPTGFPALPADWQEPKRQDVLAPGDKTPADRGERLEKLIDMSLDKAEEIMNLPLDPLDDEYVRVAALQKDLVVSILNTGVKVDENRFRKKSADALGAILAQIQAQEKAFAGSPAPQLLEQ